MHFKSLLSGSIFHIKNKNKSKQTHQKNFLRGEFLRMHQTGKRGPEVYIINCDFSEADGHFFRGMSYRKDRKKTGFA